MLSIVGLILLGMFSITDAGSFFAKAKADLAELRADTANPSKGMNCVLSFYHLHEWVWVHFLNAKCPITVKGTVIQDYQDFLRWLDQHSPHFALVQNLSRGTKHCRPARPTERVAGYGKGRWGIGAWGQPYLLIDLEEGEPTERYLAAHVVFDEVEKFWVEFFAELKIPETEVV